MPLKAAIKQAVSLQREGRANAHTRQHKVSRWSPHTEGWEEPDFRDVCGLRAIFTLQNSVYKSTCPRLLLSLAFFGLLHVLSMEGLLGDDAAQAFDIFDESIVYQVFTFALGFVLVFRVQLAYQRWWQGRTQVELMSSKWFDAFMQAVAFDHFTQCSVAEQMKFRVTLAGLFSLLHAHAVCELTHVENVAALALLTSEEPRFADTSEARCKDTVVQSWGWIIQLVAARFCGHSSVLPPMVSRIYQEMSDGMIGFRTATQIRVTPFPFPFMQIISVALIILAITFPLVLKKHVESPWWGAVFLLIAEFGYFSLAEVAAELEQPFGDDDNDLPLEEFQEEFDLKLHQFSTELRRYVPPNLGPQQIRELNRLYNVPIAGAVRQVGWNRAG